MAIKWTIGFNFNKGKHNFCNYENMWFPLIQKVLLSNINIESCKFSLKKLKKKRTCSLADLIIKCQ